MEILHSFQCLVSQKKGPMQEELNFCKATLELQEHKIFVISEKIQLLFDISYKLTLKWKCENGRLMGVEIQNFFIQGDYKNLFIFKNQLNGRVTYTGIKEVFQNVIMINETNQIKICTLTSRLDTKHYLCKCFKKDEIEKCEIYEQLIIHRKLFSCKQVSKLMEYFESSNCFYLIFEFLSPLPSINLDHEDIQSIMFDLLCSIKQLIQNQIYHSNIKIMNLHIDKYKNCKLCGFENAELLENISSNKISNMINMAGHVMLQLYQFNSQNYELPSIPDYGNSLLKNLLNENQQLNFSIDQALNHEYFAYFDYSSSPLEQLQIIPKLKTFITQQSLQQQSVNSL